ncbi:hypothetical protein GHT06_012005 [Daphnia sinensis]|uniref:Protein kinase domain-containing protein n=1 Tax=Daphnia sinensis TaxID=1820382 RepID=A0AAD5KUY9_9CRUS|nr:hypothetical protein GHT06_012005 [Daphnia sinensis]
MGLTFEFDRKEILGQGAYGPVFAGKWNNIDVAVKRIQLHDLLGDREESTMKDLDHQNVIKLYAVEEDENFKYLILERGLGTVNDYCEDKYNGKVPAEPAALYQMADGLSYIHGRGLVHRDISTGNVLFVLCGDEVVMKIADFGFCKPASENGSFSMSEGAKGTRRFLAPELLRIMGNRNEKPRGKITSDIFSLGCLFFVFLTKGIHPFSDGSIHTISLNILGNNQFLGSLEEKRATLPYALPLIQGMIEADPEKRLTLENVKDSLKLYIGA